MLRESLGDELAGLPIKNALNGPADLFLENDKNNEGRNFMFELILAGRLAGAGFRPSFDKGPDVHVKFADLQVAFQCKRPLSANRLEKNIGKAIDQLKKDNADLKLIAVSVSRLINAGDPEDMPEVRHRELGHPYLQGRLQEIAERTRRFWSGKLDRAGILFYAFTPIRCQGDPRFFFERCKAMHPLGTDELTCTYLKCFAQSLGV